MKIKTYLLMVLATCFALTLNAQTFQSGKFYYEVVDSRAGLVEIIHGPETYTNVSTTDFVTTVPFNGREYTVVGIGVGAFEGAVLATMCNLPEGYEYIDSGAFSLVSATNTGAGVTVPASMMYVASDAFEANKIGYILANANNPYFAQLSSTQDGAKYNFFCNKEKTKILAAPGQKLKGFSGGTTTYISNIVIPDQITELGDYCFCGNDNLKSVKLHKGIVKYGDGVFRKCQYLTSITLPNPDAKYGKAMFATCSSLTSVSLPAGMKSMPTSMFYNCTSLSSITLPESLEEMHNSCLTGTPLTSINLPSSLWLLDSCALQNTQITSIDLKNVKVLGRMVFLGCSNLSSIIGGDKVEEINNAVFYNCNLLSEPPYFPNLKRIYGVPYFLMNNMYEFTVPASTEYIEQNPVACCQALEEIKVEEGNQHFAEFDSCLYEIKDGKPYRLVSCPTARVNSELVVQPGTEILGRQAMRDVPLMALYGNAELKTIEVNEMKLLPTFTKIQMLAPVPPKGGTMFAEETYTDATLYVPKGSLKAYKSTEGWRDFQNIVAIDESGLKGDVNSDGVVDIIDLNILINVVLGKTEIDIKKGDLNGDTIIDIVDVNNLINIILKQS